MAFRRCATLLALLLAMPASVRAQGARAVDLSHYDAPSALPGWRGEVALVGANAVIGGVVTGLIRELRGGSFRSGFVAGAAGATVAYGGRRLSVLDVTGAGLVGRQLNGVGASMVRNAAAGEPVLGAFILPVGPFRLYVDRSGAEGVSYRLKLHAHEAFWLVRGALDDELALRWEATLSAGAPVFQKKSGRLDVGGSDVNGYQLGGAIFLSGEAGAGQAWTLAHERIHVLQSDFLAIAWVDALEGWAMEQSGPSRALHRWVDVGLLEPGLRSLLVRVMGVHGVNGAQEFEAELLESR